MHTVNFLRHLVENYQVLVYIFIFLGLIVEGEIILISAGIFLHLGALDYPITLSVVFFGVLAKTFLGYHLGVFIHKTWHETRFLKYLAKRISSVMPHFKQDPFWSIFISKFIIGFNNAVIIYSGYQKINYKKYLKAEFLSTLLWVPILLLLGYFFSYTAISYSKEVWRFSFVVFVLVVGFIIIDKLLGWALEIFEEFYHDHVE